jgi:prepilin-type N-terminal cleavage/methylation domain-containing protein
MTEASRITDTRAFRGGCSEAGFTLIEIMLVATVVGIVAAIAVPQISRARAASFEASTISSLREVQRAQSAYAASCGSGAYAPTILRLATAPKAGAPLFIAPGFTADTIDRAGYRLRFTAGTKIATAPATCNGLAKGLAVDGYFLEAAPLQAIYGTRYFGISQRTVIYQSTARVAPIFTGNPPLPARPIQ